MNFVNACNKYNLSCFSHQTLYMASSGIQYNDTSVFSLMVDLKGGGGGGGGGQWAVVKTTQNC